MAESKIHVKSTPPPGGCLGNKPHKCYICGRRFGSQNGLEGHVSSHYDDNYNTRLSPIAEQCHYGEENSTNLDQLQTIKPNDNDFSTRLDQLQEIEQKDNDDSTTSNEILKIKSNDSNYSTRLNQTPLAPSMNNPKCSAVSCLYAMVLDVLSCGRRQVTCARQSLEGQSSTHCCLTARSDHFGSPFKLHTPGSDEVPDYPPCERKPSPQRTEVSPQGSTFNKKGKNVASGGKDGI